MSRCPTCGAPAGPTSPDGDFRYRPTTLRSNAFDDLVVALQAARAQIAYDLEGAAGAAKVLGDLPRPVVYGEAARLLDTNREKAEGVLADIDAALAKAGIR